MKIGLSYSRCVRDIVDGIVDIDDILVVITRTDFDPHNDESGQASGLVTAAAQVAALASGVIQNGPIIRPRKKIDFEV
jgi:hypothetical protein